MFFLLRTAFWLSLLILLIPADPAEVRKDAETRNVSPIEAIGAAHSTWEDISGFCDRNPGTCDTGRAALSGFGAKARTGAHWIYRKLEGEDATATGSTPPPQQPVRREDRVLAVPLPPVRPVT